jgi:hypothetical protein
MRAICLLFAVWIGTVPVDAAVEFLTGVNRDTITIGDPFVLRMRMSRGADDRAEIVFGEDFPKPFEIRQTGEVQRQKRDDGRVQETRDLVLVIFEVGAFVVPPVSVHFVTADGDSGVIESQPIAVFVQSVKPDGTTDIRDVKPPVVVVAQIPLWLWLVLGGLMLLIVGLGWYIYRRRRRPQIELPPSPVNWLEELQKIDRLSLLEHEKYRQYYSLLSDVLRRCLEAQTSVHAVERTTVEIGRDLRTRAFEDDTVGDIERFLNEADMVKFAKFTPRESVAIEAIDHVRQIVQVLIKPTLSEDVTP